MNSKGTDQFLLHSAVISDNLACPGCIQPELLFNLFSVLGSDCDMKVTGCNSPFLWHCCR